MRLTCPDCSAQYEVDEAVIPADGRDVQCSNCNRTWFQKSAQMLRDEAGAAAQTAEEDEASPAPAAAGGLKRRELDPSVLDVLREEAERESEARKAEGSSLEMQTDLGLAPPPPPPAPEPQKAEEPEVDPALVPRPSRRELLPDIEEINSTLRATSERSGDAAAIDAPETLRHRRSGFRRGFVSAVGLTVGLLLPYLLSGSLSNAVPAIAPALAAYSNVIDGARTGLDTFLRGLTDSLQSDDAAGG